MTRIPLFRSEVLLQQQDFLAERESYVPSWFLIFVVIFACLLGAALVFWS